MEAGPAARPLQPANALHAVSAGLVAFLALVGVGAVLLVAAKAHTPGLGTGLHPLEVVAALAIAGLAALGVPVDVAGFELAVMPLGALAAAGAGVAWASALGGRRLGGLPGSTRVLLGAATGPVLGALCGLAAVAFRVDGAAAHPWWSLALGTLWGAAFGALGGIRAGRMGPEVLGALRRRAPAVRAGIAGAARMVALGSLAGAGLGIVWVVQRAGPALLSGLSAGDAVGGAIYLGALLPNLAIAALTLALGGSVEVSAGLELGGQVLGDGAVYSVWDRGALGPLALALPLAPLLACVAGGARCRAEAQGRGPAALLVAAGLFSATVGLWALLGGARIGTALTDGVAAAGISLEPWSAAGLAFVWALAGGAAGWTLQGRRRLRGARRSVRAGAAGA